MKSKKKNVRFIFIILGFFPASKRSIFFRPFEWWGRFIDWIDLLTYIRFIRPLEKKYNTRFEMVKTVKYTRSFIITSKRRVGLCVCLYL